MARDTSSGRGRTATLAIWLGAASSALACATAPEPKAPPGPPAEPPAERRAAAPAPPASESDRLFELALDRWVARSERIQQISQRIRVAGRDQCEARQAAVFGAAVLDLSALPPVLQEVGRARFGTDTGVFVTAVFPGMAAERAGVRPGDRVAKIEGSRVGALRDLAVSFGASREDLVLALESDDGSRTVVIEPERGCGVPAELILSEEVNAYATPQAILLTTALVRELRDDTALALVIGHEIAHQIHDVGVEKRWRRAPTYSVRAESQADYLGVYLAVMAGYPLDEDPELYLALSRDLDQLARRSASHPTHPERAAAFRRTLEEIAERKQAGLPLSPGS